MAFKTVRRDGATMPLVTASHYVSFFLGTRFPRLVPLVFVVGYPKSGTTWATQLVADYLELPYPQLSILPVGFAAVVHGHERISPRFEHCVYVMRDGRDALVSMYFELSRHIPPGDRPRMTRRQRRQFPGLTNRDHVQRNMAAFVERQIERPEGCRWHWGRHVGHYLETTQPNLALLRYENLLSDGPATLATAMATLTDQPPDPDRAAAAIARFDFARQSGRSAGDEDRSQFLRKGRTGDWINHFTREAAEIFDHHCGDALIAAGYEPDHSWVKNPNR